MHFSHFFRRLICRLLIVPIALSVPSVGFPPLPANADSTEPTIIFEEISWAGSSLSQADEWIELANRGDATTTIGGWSLIGAAPKPIFLPPDALIPPHGTYVISNYPETDEKSALVLPVQLATTTIALSNSVLGIKLADASGIVVDRVGTGQIPPAGSSTPKATMIRASTSTTDLLTEWISATSSRGFKTDVTDFGAPGICHLCLLNTITNEQLPELTPGEAMDELVPADPIPEQTTSTPAVPSVEESITTTSTGEALPQTSATTTEMAPPAAETATTPVVSSPLPVITTVTAPPALRYSLNEVISNPAAGPEWVELRVTETTVTSTDRALELWDKSGRFMTIPADTPLTSPGYLVMMLTSARLNNNGDDLSIREVPLNGTSGIVLDLIQIPALEDGVAWAKTDAGSWMETEELTPGSANRFFTAVVIPPIKTINTTQVTTPTKATSSPAPSETPPTSTIPLGPPLTILLNEVMSVPDSGKEWVELWIAEMSATVTDRPYELWDASGRIASIPAGTAMTAPGYLLVTLTSARLNNSGDALSLREAGGDLTLDTTEIPALNKGVSWARSASDEWTDTDAPTPGSANRIQDEQEPPEGIPSAKNKSTQSLNVLTQLTTDMSQEKPVSARVRLVGTVGSVPRLLGATHAFILLGEDGRAAIAYLPKHLNTPSFGATVRVMGSLTATERQLELRMKTSDVWMTITTSTPPRPREVDFLAPGMEDAWGLVAATGTVKTTGTKSVMINVEGVDVTVNIPTAVGYRAKRLVKGDVIHVTGLLDPRKENPTILIRVPEDIELVAHAPDTVTSTGHTDGKKSSSLPDWTPFGAAAGAVAATGGIQRLRTYLRRRKLEMLAIQNP